MREISNGRSGAASLPPRGRIDRWKSPDVAVFVARPQNGHTKKCIAFHLSNRGHTRSEIDAAEAKIVAKPNCVEAQKNAFRRPGIWRGATLCGHVQVYHPETLVAYDVAIVTSRGRAVTSPSGSARAHSLCSTKLSHRHHLKQSFQEGKFCSSDAPTCARQCSSTPRVH